MPTVLQSPTVEETESAWTNASALGSTDPFLFRFDKHGARMDKDKHNNLEDQAGWVVIRNDDGTLEAINQFFRLPPDARALINKIKML